MKYLHTMVRVENIEKSLNFYCNLLGLKEIRRRESEKGRFTLIFLAAENKSFTATIDINRPVASPMLTAVMIVESRCCRRLLRTISQSVIAPPPASLD